MYTTPSGFKYTTLEDIIKDLPPESLERIKKGTEKEKKLFFNRIAKQVKKRLDLTQLENEKKINISQPAISALKKRGDDTSISTLAEYVKSLGCTIDINITLPNGESITKRF